MISTTKSKFGIARAWESFWFLTGPPHALATFRILFGIFWFTRWIWLAPHVPLLFSGEGMHFPAFPPPRNGIHNFETLVGWVTNSPSVPRAWMLYSVTLVLILLIITGLFTRIALFLFFLSLNYHYYLYFHMHGTSYDRVLLLMTFLLVLSPCGRVLSLDEWFRKRRSRQSVETYSLWTQRMICVQIAIVYFATGVHKLTSPAWKNGDNLASSFYGDYATSLGYWIARLHIPLGYFDVFTLVTIFFEVAVSVLLFSKRWQKWCFLFGGLFHLINSSVLWIPEFLIVVCSYVLFVDPSGVKKFVEDHFDFG